MNLGAMTPAGEAGTLETILVWILAFGVFLFLMQAMGDFIGGVVRFFAAILRPFPVFRNSYHVHMENFENRPQQARRGDPLAPDEDENAGWIQGTVHRREKEFDKRS